MPTELEQAAHTYEEQDGTYLSMVRQGASPDLLLVAATAAWQAADRWQTLAYRAYFDHLDHAGGQGGQGGHDDKGLPAERVEPGAGPSLRELDVESEIAEALTDLWWDVAQAHRSCVERSSPRRT